MICLKGRPLYEYYPMSSLRGEQALKDGLSFEFTWTARHLIEVMEERAEAITLGGLPGEKGVDFRLHFSNHEEHHQVKRAFGTEGEWTLAALDSEKILPDFRQRLVDPKVHCYMVSGIPAVQLSYLADRARRSSDFITFKLAYLTGDYSNWFTDLVRRWDLSPDECWQRLLRVYTRPFSENDQTSCCYTMLRSMIVERVEDAWTHLRDFCFYHVQQRVTASEIWQWLAKKGIKRQIVNNDPRVLTRIEAQTKIYLDGVRQKLIKPPLPRQLAATIVTSLTESSYGEDIVVLGSPGGGKSAVMFQIAESCIGKGWPVLAFRLDDLPATASPKQLQDALDLPSPPAVCMAHASAGKPALVIIDQLDAVSQYSGRTGTLFDRVATFVEDLRAHRLRNPIHLVIACREVDWLQDGRFRPLHRSKSVNKDDGIHKVENLTDGEISLILASSGLDKAMFSPRQQEQLLRRPQYLALLIETKPNADSLQGIVTPKHLFDAYWTKKQSDLALALPSQNGNQWFDILKHITEKLAETALALTPPVSASSNDEAPLAVTRSSLDRFPPLVIGWMITNGVLAEGNRRIRFGHESFFDYCFARFFEERGQSLLAYLLQSEQTLIQRGQLRQVLAYLRDENMEAYLKSARELLTCDQIRPHLKYLLITVLCEIPDPKDSEWELIAPRIREALVDFDTGMAPTVSCQVFSAFHNSLVLFKMACAKGAFASWLQNSGPSSLEYLFRVLLKHQEKAQEDVWTLINPLVTDERYNAQLNWLSHYCRASNSRETFEWLLSVKRRSYASEKNLQPGWNRFYALTDDLSKNKPAWLAEWLAVAIREKANPQNKVVYELLSSEDVSTEKIGQAVERAPREFIEYILPAIQETIHKSSNQYSGGWAEFDCESSSGGFRYVSPDEALFDSLVHALYRVLQTDREFALVALGQLRNSDLISMQRLHAAVFLNDDEICASLAANYLANGGDAFSVTYKGRLVACEIIKSHANRLNDSQIFAIEMAILKHWPRHQNQRIPHYGNDSPLECRGNWRGYQQMKLLRSFPVDRLSKTGAKRLAELERKFDSTKILYVPHRRETPVNKDAISLWEPKRFLRAITARQKRIPKSWRMMSNHEGKIGPMLREVVAKRPAEFIHYLHECGSDTPKEFIDEIADGLMNLEIDSALALTGAKNFHRLGPSWSWRTIRLLEKVKPGSCFREAFEIVLEYAKNGSGVAERPPAEDGKQGERLHGMARDCTRGHAIGTMCQMLYADPDILDDLKPDLPKMMSDPCPAIRTELAAVCYAVAFKEENRSFATKLFLNLVNDQLPDEHVLTSHWPAAFICAGQADDWNTFKPILVKMLASLSSEVRSTAARLICIALISGVAATDLAQECVVSGDPKVRAACAEILIHNLDTNHGKQWCIDALLKLADDSDMEVCRAAAFGFNKNDKIDFAPLSDFLTQYAKTRAFVRGAGRLIDVIVDSNSILPAVILDIIETIIDRLHEPVEEGADRLVWHIDMVSPALTRIYHENRDGALRKRALDLIDKLCVNGSVSHESLDR